MALFLTILSASLLGSLHCAGMCGGLVAVYTAGSTSSTHRAHFAYHTGRLLSYMSLGAAAGLVGSGLDVTGSFAGVSRLAAWIAGISIIAFALSRHRWRRIHLKSPRFLSQLFARFIKLFARWSPFGRALMLGLGSSLLPCGWLYAFAVVAAGTGSPLWGSLIMASFWLGTVPILAALGLGLERYRHRMAQLRPGWITAVLIVVGILMLTQRASLAGLTLEAKPKASRLSDPALIEQVEEIGEDVPPCCRK